MNKDFNTKNRLKRELERVVYWKTKASSDKSLIQTVIQKWLKKNPQYIDLYLENSEVIYQRCCGAMQGRKETLAEIKNIKSGIEDRL